MRHYLPRVFAAAILSLFPTLLSVSPARADDAPDRAALSVEENITINAACFGARVNGDKAYNQCVRDQLTALAAHPSPDRSSLSASRNKTIERDCQYLRRAGIADYNDCLKKGVATHGTASADAPGEGLSRNFAKFIRDHAADTAEPIAATATLPKALREVLSRRPDRVSTQTLAPTDVYRKVQHSVFVVIAAPTLADAQEKNIMLGSAVAISDQLLLTNCHVVLDRPVLRIVQDEVISEVTLVAADRQSDRCILKSAAHGLQPITGVRAYTDLAVGERVFAIGTPHALERTLSEGLVSGLRKRNGVDMVQTTAPLSPGSSGGGLFDERGNLIGITTLASFYESQNLNFAIAASAYWE